MTEWNSVEPEGPLFNLPVEISEAEQRFLDYHERHPEVYRMFLEMAMKARRKGREHYSARTIIEIIRWNKTIEEDADEEFKINDHYSPYYSRLAMKENPELEGFFELRVMHKKT